MIDKMEIEFVTAQLVAIRAHAAKTEDHAKQCGWWLEVIIGLLAAILWRIW